MKRLVALFLIALLVLGGTSFTAVAKSPYEGVEVIRDKDGKVVDLGGMEIIIGDWWTAAEQPAPTTAQEEATVEYREWIQSTYNFKIRQVAVTDWGNMPEFVTNFATTGGPENYVFLTRPGTQAAPMNSGLFYDLATLDCLDFTQPKWNAATKAFMTKGDSIYGMRPETGEPRTGVFFNKRMLEEAGIDPESLYDMQKDGTWTWEAFEELCKKITRDTNNDGVIDVYAMCSFGVHFLGAALASNGACFVDIDENGKYYNATGSDAFLEAANWAVEMLRNYEYPQPEGTEWNYFEASFQNGAAAMQVHQDYYASTLNANMEDDYGFVMFPKGPRMDTYVNVWEDNITVIPACYDADRAWKIAFAYNLYTNPTPGYDDVDDWKSSYYAKYRDTRAVDETVAMMRDSAHAVTWYHTLISGYDLGPDFYWDVAARAVTPAEKLESMKAQWQAYLDATNGN